MPHKLYQSLIKKLCDQASSHGAKGSNYFSPFSPFSTSASFTAGIIFGHVFEMVLAILSLFRTKGGFEPSRNSSVLHLKKLFIYILKSTIYNMYIYSLYTK